MFLYEECEKYLSTASVVSVHKNDSTISTDEFLAISGGIPYDECTKQLIALYGHIISVLDYMDVQSLEWNTVRVTHSFVTSFLKGEEFDPNTVPGYTEFIDHIKSKYDSTKISELKQEQKDLYNNLVLICLPELYKLHILKEHVRDFIKSFYGELLNLDSTIQSRVLALLGHNISITYNVNFEVPDCGKYMCISLVKYITDLNLDD